MIHNNPNLVSNMPRTVKSYTILIKTQHAHGCSPDVILKTLQTMIDEGKHPNIRTYAAVLNAISEDFPEYSHGMYQSLGLNHYIHDLHRGNVFSSSGNISTSVENLSV
jgi:hypothetical protein